MAGMNTLRKGEDWIDNTLIREAAEEAAEELGWHEIARRLGWLRKGPGKRGQQTETSALKRRLGIVGEPVGSPPSRNIRYDIAVEICRAIGRDPVDVDL